MNQQTITPEQLNEAFRQAEEAIKLAKAQLCSIMPFFGHLLLKLNVRQAFPEYGITTAAVTPDRTLYVNPTWFNSLSSAQQNFVLIHEVEHLVLSYFARQEVYNAKVWVSFPCPACKKNGHLPTCQVCKGTNEVGYTAALFNLAHDYAINGELVEMDYAKNILDMVPGGLLDSKYKGMSAEEIYHLLYAEAEKNGEKAGQNGMKSTEGLQMPGQEGQWGDNDGRDDLGEDGPQDPNGISSSERQAQEDFWKLSLIEAAQVNENSPHKGKLPGSLQKLIDEIRDPSISWVEALSKWVGENGKREDYSWRRPSRRSPGLGILLPSRQKYGVDDIVVLWDTSGSMHGREVMIMSEVIGICEQVGMSLRVILCDMQITEDIKNVTKPEQINWSGGGGSDFRPGFDRLDKEGYRGVVIAFTDGYIDVPDVKPPHIRDTLWVLWEGPDVNPTKGRWGETLWIKDGYLVRPKLK